MNLLKTLCLAFRLQIKANQTKGFNVLKCDCKYWQTKQFNLESEAVYLKHTVWMVAEWEMKNAELKNLALDVEDEGEAAVSIYNRFGEIPLCFWFLIFWIITILRKNSNMLMICTIKIKFIQSKPFYPHSKWSSFSFIWITIFRCWSRAYSWPLRVNFH